MKKVNLYIFLTLCSFAIFLLTTPSKVKAEVVDKQTQHQLQDYMKDHHINGVMLVNGKDGKTIAIENNETTNKDQIVKADRLIPTATLQKLDTGTTDFTLKLKKHIE